MMRWLTITALALLPVAGGDGRASQAQRDAPGARVPTGTAVIAGRVVNSDQSGQPVRRARITLESDRLPPVTADADSDGRFRLDALPAGRYRLSATKAGFVLHPTLAGRPPEPVGIQVQDGQTLNADILMDSAAALEGRLTNESGDPLANVVVSAVRLVYGAYGKQPSVIRQARTDDLGRFRIHTLVPGSYFLNAEPDALANNQPQPAEGKPEGFARTYYPGTNRVSDATSLTLSVGQDLTNLDFVLISAVRVTVEARVNDSSNKPPKNFGTRMQRVGGPTGEVRGLSSPQDNYVRFEQVPPGDYYLIATAQPAAGGPQEYAVNRVTLTGQGSAAPITIATGRAAAVEGHVDVAGNRAPLPAGLRVTAYETQFEVPTIRDLGQMQTPGQPAGTVGGDGSFAFESIFGPRLFRVTGLPTGWVLTSVRVDDREVADTPTDLPAADRPHVVRLTIAPQAASVAGSVDDENGSAVPRARIVLFSEDATTWQLRSRLIATTEAGDDGRFTIEGVLPGKYHVIAVPYLPENAWLDPDVLGRLAALSTSVTVTEGAKLSVKLKLRGLP